MEKSSYTIVKDHLRTHYLVSYFVYVQRDISSSHKNNISLLKINYLKLGISFRCFIGNMIRQVGNSFGGTLQDEYQVTRKLSKVKHRKNGAKWLHGFSHSTQRKKERERRRKVSFYRSTLSLEHLSAEALERR